MKALRICLVFTVACLAVHTAFAGQESEIESLKRRVSELESQNRAILQALESLRGRLESQPATGAPVTAQQKKAPAEAANQAAPSPKMDAAVQWKEIAAGESRMRFYGFLRLDALSDTARPDSPQNPFYILSEDPRAGGDTPRQFSLFPRLTRFGANFQGPSVHALGDARISGQLEIDFNNGGSESRAIPRMRHANLRLTRGSFYVLAGQTFDLSSPLLPVVNNTTGMWNAGNLGDRRAQLQAVYEPKAGPGQLYLGISLGLTGAIDGLDLDQNGIRDGEDSGIPNFQGRVAYTHRSAAGRSATIGLSGHRGWERTSRPYLGMNEFRSQSVGMDWTLPLGSRVSLLGEMWTGRNLSDIRGGIAQGINPQTGAPIRSRGGWIETGIRTGRYWTFSPGFTIDDPLDPDIPQNGRIRNRAWYVGNRFTLGGGLSIGADYLRWITDYKGLERGADHRVNLFVQYAY